MEDPADRSTDGSTGAQSEKVSTDAPRFDRNTEFYKVLTNQIETLDPTTGEEKWLPMYDHAWTDGKGNYFLSDGDAQTLPFEDASDWRPLQVVNRNDPAYRSR